MNENWIREMVGHAEVELLEPVVAGSYGTWRVIYHVGKFGVDDGGGIKVSTGWASDWGRPQMDNPEALDYLTVQTTGKAKLRSRYEPKAHVRPWQKCVVIDVYDGYLGPGDTVTITYGDKSQGSLGSRSQTFCEKSFEFRVLVDCFGTFMGA